MPCAQSVSILVISEPLVLQCRIVAMNALELFVQFFELLDQTASSRLTRPVARALDAPNELVQFRDGWPCCRGSACFELERPSGT